MAKRRGLPKKYAKMGFKRGWRAYRASKRSRRKPAKRSYTRRGTPRRRMARKTKSLSLISTGATLAIAKEVGLLQAVAEVVAPTKAGLLVPAGAGRATVAGDSVANAISAVVKATKRPEVAKNIATIAGMALLARFGVRALGVRKIGGIGRYNLNA